MITSVSASVIPGDVSMFTVKAGNSTGCYIVAQVDNNWVIVNTEDLGRYTLKEYIIKAKSGLFRPPSFIRPIGSNEGYEFQKEYPRLVVYTSSVDISKVIQCDISIDEPDTYPGQKEQQATIK